MLSGKPLEQRARRAEEPAERRAVPQRPEVSRTDAHAALHRRHRRERHRRARLRHGRRDRRLQQRRLRRSLRHQARAESAAPQQLRRHVHRRDGREPHGRSGLERVGGVRRLRSRRLARSVRRPLSRTTRSPANVVCYSVSGQRDYCPPNVYRAQPSHLFRNNRDGTFTDVTAAAGMAREFGPALGVSTADFNRRRLDRYLRRQRRRAESALDQSAQRHVQEHGARSPARRSAPRDGRRPAWAWTPATSTTTATRISSSAS